MGSHRIHIDNTAADSLNVCISLCKKPLEPGIRQTYQSTKDVLTANKIVAKISRLETPASRLPGNLHEPGIVLNVVA